MQTSVERFEDLTTVCTTDGTSCDPVNHGKYTLENNLGLTKLHSTCVTQTENIEFIGVNYPILKVDHLKPPTYTTSTSIKH